MGLDNGFICKNIKRNEIPSYVRLPWDCRDEDVEIAYFRKCWGIRGEIIRLLHVKDDEYKIDLINRMDEDNTIITQRLTQRIFCRLLKF